MSEISNEVVQIVRRISGAREVSPSSRVYQDLGVAGDDAWEMLRHLGDRFSVSLTDFDFSRYFPAETEAMGEHWAKMFRLVKPRPPLTVEHLIAVAERKCWFEPEQTSD